MKPRNIILKTIYCKTLTFNSQILKSIKKRSNLLSMVDKQMVGMEEDIRLADSSEPAHSASTKLSMCCVMQVHF